jgi:hypothetical protein
MPGGVWVHQVTEPGGVDPFRCPIGFGGHDFECFPLLGGDHLHHSQPIGSSAVHTTHGCSRTPAGQVPTGFGVEHRALPLVPP